GGDPVAVDAHSYSLYAVLTDKWSSKSTKPQYVTEKEKTAESLAKYLPMSKQNILSRLNKSADQVEFGSAGKNLSYEIKKGIEDDNLSGIFFKETPIRLYPNGTFSSHLIGMAQLPTDKNGEMKEDSELTGYMGIEQAYNSDLTGKDGGTEYKKDSFGYVLPSAETKTTQPKDGKDIYLTLDKRMQVYLESIMTEVNDEYSPKAVTATLMDPKTGAIVATSQRPSFNGTTKEGIDQLWQNLLAEYSYEPGSTFKVLTLAAAVNEGVFNPNETYQSGSVKVADRVIRDVNRNGWGTISYLEGVERSSNVAFVNLMKKMGPEVWKNYLDKFGIGKSTNSGLLNESDGSNPYNYAAEKATSSFGQGLTVTVLQMLQAFSAVANDGKMMKPHYISKFVDPNTQEEKMIKPEVVSEPISKKAAHQTLDYLKNVVYGENGTGKRFQIEGYEIAAKTGTAQIVNPETKNYFSGGNNYIYSVVGMAPANDPEYLLYVTVQQPKINKPGIAGGDVVAEIFNPVMKRALEYSHLNEEDKQNENQVEMP
ncbi:MAG: penicillin-binding protein 2, partial [Pisciglobus halotolerans]|nr:penicillin-binding protein 2 [Pisciglobus halotolerans]